MNLGTLGYLRLADFEPEWRQGVLIPNEKDKKGKKLIFAVRILEAEIEDKSSEFTPFDVEDHTFILVEGTIAKTSGKHACIHIEPSRWVITRCCNGRWKFWQGTTFNLRLPQKVRSQW